MNSTSERMAKALYGWTAKEAIAERKCVKCRGDADALTYSDAGAREYEISGVCEQCFDEMFDV